MTARNPASSPVIREQDVACTARDGTILRADVYRPDSKGPLPTLLNRTPYDKATRKEVAMRLAERGYLVVVQDVRGRYASGGEFRPGFYSADHCDAEDGYDAVEWAASLPGASGRVGTFGNSYDGWTQRVLAPMRPPHLQAILPSGIAANLLDRELSGVLRLGRVLWWSVNTLSVDAGRRLNDPDAPPTLDEADRVWVERDRSKWMWYLPLMEIPDHAMPGIGHHWRRWLSDHTTDHFGFEQSHGEVDVPALNMTGWYDQQIGAIRNFTGTVENGRSGRVRDSQYLMVGPWTHTLVDLDRQVGKVDFGPEAARDYVDIADCWFRRWLKDEEEAIADWPRVQVFVMGANRWRSADTWPLPETRYSSYYLHSNGNARSVDGDGLLSQEAPADEPADEYDYDPRDPMMTLFTPAGQQVPLDQRALDGRRDVLVYTTPPLELPLEVTGPVEMRLWAASSAPDTDFVVKLLDVWPDGFVQELCHGIVRARYRESYAAPTPIRRGQVYEYRIKVNPTSNLFQPGHRIRLDVSSSDFPNFDRNHNTGLDDYTDASLQTARQTVFHDAERPSQVMLPVIPA